MKNYKNRTNSCVYGKKYIQIMTTQEERDRMCALFKELFDVEKIQECHILLPNRIEFQCLELYDEEEE